MISLRSGLTALGLSGNESRVILLERYLSELELWNPRYKLVADGENLIARHLLDSLAGLSFIRALGPKSLADIGSGAGLPGIPLAIWLDECSVSLVERSGKRAGFLRNVILSLGLSHIFIEETPVEQLAGRFDVITFRAYSALDETLLRTMKKILAPDGVIMAYKGRRELVDQELSSLSEHLEDVKIHPLEVPGLDEERHLVILRLSDR